MSRKFDNEEFNDLYCLPNSLINGCDIEHKTVRKKFRTILYQKSIREQNA